jgi:hypothetical protein
MALEESAEASELLELQPAGRTVFEMPLDTQAVELG